MLEAIISRLKEEIASDVDYGTPIDAVWEYTASVMKEHINTDLTNKICIDDNYKAYLWNMLKKETDLFFFERIDNNNSTEDVILEDVEVNEEDNQKKRKTETVKSKSPPKKKRKATKKTKKTKKKTKKQYDGDSDSSYGDHMPESEEESEEESDGSVKGEEVVEVVNVAAPKVYAKGTMSQDSLKNYSLIPIPSIIEYDYATVKEKYGQQLQVVASSELQNEQLMTGIAPDVVLSPNLIVILKAILKTKHMGLLQVDITRQLGVDPRSTGHYCKSLEEKGAIVRQPRSFPGQHTNLCVHKRFWQARNNTSLDKDLTAINITKSGESLTVKLLKSRIVDMLNNAPDHIMFSSDIFTLLGLCDNTRVRKWYNRYLDEMFTDGIISKSNNIKEKGKLNLRCITLLKVPDELSKKKETEPFVPKKFPIVLKSSRHTDKLGHIYREKSTTKQVWDLIEKSGTSGIIQKEICTRLCTSEQRVVYKWLEGLLNMDPLSAKYYAIVNVIEFESRIRRYRYFTQMHYQSLQGIVKELAAPPSSLIDPNCLKEINRSTVYPTDKGSFMAFIKRIVGTDMGYFLSNQARSSKKVKIPKIQRNMDVENETKNVQKKKPGKAKATAASIASDAINSPASSTSDKVTKASTLETCGEVSSLTQAATDANHSINDQEELPLAQSFATEDSLTDSLEESSRKRTIPEDLPTSEKFKSKKVKHVSLPVSMEEPMESASPLIKSESSVAPTTSKSKISPLSPVVLIPAKKKNEIIKKEEKSTPKTKSRMVNKKHTNTISNYFQKLPKDATLLPSTENNLGGCPPTDNQPRKNPSESPISEEDVEESQTIARDTSAPIDAVDKNNVDMDTSNSAEDHVMDEAMEDISSSENNTKPSVSRQVYSTSKRDAPLRSTEAMKASGIKYAPHKKVPTNSYLLNRVKVLKQMIEERRVLELGTEFMKDYKKAYLEIIGTPCQSGICPKTIWATASVLKKNGDAQMQIVRKKLYTGRHVVKKLIFHVDVDLDGEEYKNHINNMVERLELHSKYQVSNKIEKETLVVEKLDQRLQRMKNEYDDLIKQGKQGEAFALQKKIEQYTKYADTSSEKNPLMNTHWLITAVQYGWVNAKMTRAKILHIYMMSLLLSSKDIEGVDKESSTITSRALISNLSLQIVGQIVGFSEVIPQLVEWMKDPAYTKMKVGEFSDEVINVCGSQLSRIRPRLRELLDVLQYLGLTTAIVPGDNVFVYNSRSMATSYVLAREVNIREVRIIGHPCVSEHMLNTIDDINSYWHSVRYVYTKRLQLKDDEKAPYPTDPSEKTVYSTLFSRNPWSTFSLFSRDQRKILNSYINKSEYTTPLENMMTCQKIANQIGMSIHIVRGYYKKYQMALDKKKDSNMIKSFKASVQRRNRRRHKSTPRPRPNGNVDESSFSQYSPGNKIYLKVQGKTRAIRSNWDNGSSSFMDEMKNIPEVENGSIVDYQPQRRTRDKWSSQQDDILIYSVIILKSRLPFVRFFYHPLKSLLPNLSPSKCRNRMYKLSTIPEMAQKIEISTSRWRRYLAEGLASNELSENDFYNDKRFDLAFHLKYFLRRLYDDENGNVQNDGKCFLPTTPEEVNKMYLMESTSELSSLQLDELYHRCTSIVTKSLTLNSAAFVMTRWSDNEPDSYLPDLKNESNLKHRNTYLIKSLIMSILLSPQEIYDNLYAYYLITQFPEEEVKSVAQKMKADKLLVLRAVRRIPSHTLGLSTLFLRKIATTLPDKIYEQAKEYGKFLSRSQDFSTVNTDMVSSGMMLCLISLSSLNDLNIALTNKEESLHRMYDLPCQARSIDGKNLSFHLKVQKKKPDTLSLSERTPNKMNRSDPTEFVCDSDAFEHRVADFLSQNEGVMRDLAARVIHLLDEQQDLGMSLTALKERLSSKFSDEEISECIRLLSTNIPPIIHRVGFQAYRYVTFKHAVRWMVRFNRGFNPSNELQITGKLKENLRERKALVPGIYKDIFGDDIDFIRKRWESAIYEFIFKRPGTAESHIYREFSVIVSRADVKDTLEGLLAKNIIRKVCTARLSNQKFSVFSKVRTTHLVKKNHIDDSIISYYWVNESHYLGRLD
ncbi:hypothetical protein BDB01DRAFT_494136 [Pilobolus umbonatus]|nr:hypothetical protein BDB01DRAFT_494136 [Pilobolus umbonatus]